MTFYVENETSYVFPFDDEQLANQVVNQALLQESFPYETSLNLLITDNEGIRTYNKEYRGIDKETDVLSFPNIDYENPAEYDYLEQDEVSADYFDLDTGEAILGDIIISFERMVEQAKEYGHSVRREFAFLIAHSMLHLLGYDHMTEEEAKVMEEKQELILLALDITRE